MRQTGGDSGRQAGVRERMASRSAFYKLRAKGGATIRCDAPSSESCPSIGSRPYPARLLGPEVAPFAHPARHGPEPRNKIAGRVLVTGRGLCGSRMPVRGTPGELRLVLLTCLAHPHATRSEWPGPRSTPIWWQIASMRRCVEARGDFSCVREMLVVEVVSECGAR